MERRAFDTPLGEIWLWGEPAAFASDKPLVLAVAGAFAIEKGPLFHLAPHLAPRYDVVTGHLPGNHCPPLAATSIGVYAAAYAHVVRTAFPDRRIILCGASVGGLVTLGLRAPQVKGALVMEPPLLMSKVWAMTDFLRQRLRDAPPGDPVRDFIVNVFGVTAEGVEERDYRPALDHLDIPVRVMVGDQPVYPRRPFDKLPSLVDEPERALMAAHPAIQLAVAPNAGHNVVQQATGMMLQNLRELLAGLDPA